MEKYFDASYIWNAIPQLLPFLKVTFLIAGLSVFFGTLLGFILTLGKINGNRLVRKSANGYTTVLRCTPSIVLLFLVYYGVPALGNMIGLNLNEIHTAVFVVLTFTLQFGAVMSEVMRSAYLSINQGQYEAAVSVGLSPWQAFRRIVFPQAFVVALPNFGNSLLAVLQEGSLAYTIGLIDIVGKANLLIAGNYNSHTLEIFIALALIYWVISIAIEQFFFRLENKVGKGKRILKSV